MWGGGVHGLTATTNFSTRHSAKQMQQRTMKEPKLLFNVRIFPTCWPPPASQRFSAYMRKTCQKGKKSLVEPYDQVQITYSNRTHALTSADPFTHSALNELQTEASQISSHSQIDSKWMFQQRRQCFYTPPA